MDQLVVTGGIPLKGVIKIDGAKNATLPLIAAGLLTSQDLILHNVPQLADVESFSLLVQEMGGRCDYRATQNTLNINTKNLHTQTAPYERVRKMRASILVLGPLLARFGQARVSLPGGCAIGVRPIDLHIQAMEALGANVTLKDGNLEAAAPKGLQGSDYTFPKITVTGTANMMMAAALAEGETVIRNAATEPEITDLAACLKKMGAKIQGAGKRIVRIQGVTSLNGTTHTVIPDRIEMGTYALAAAITGGEVLLKGGSMALLPAFHKTLQAVGIHPVQKAEGTVVHSPGPKNLQPADIKTAPHPDFPTDLQAQMMALLTLVPGTSHITETLFENRFMHVAELARMGADIHIHHNRATITGQKQLTAAPLMATDLRASASLVLAALAAEGTSTISRIYHLDRGYAAMEKKLAACGAEIKRRQSTEKPGMPLKPSCHNLAQSPL